jgi:hypothetical protein
MSTRRTYEFEVVEVVEEDVFGFEVAVGNAFAVHVLEHVDYFTGIMLGQWVWKDLYRLEGCLRAMRNKSKSSPLGAYSRTKYSLAESLKQ